MPCTGVARSRNRRYYGRVNSQLEEFRRSIDNLDNALVYLLAERFRITGDVGVFKRDAQLPSEDPQRERDQLIRLRTIADSAGLDPAVVDVVFPAIMQEVRRRHDHVRGNGSRG